MGEAQRKELHGFDQNGFYDGFLKSFLSLVLCKAVTRLQRGGSCKCEAQMSDVLPGPEVFRVLGFGVKVSSWRFRTEGDRVCTLVSRPGRRGEVYLTESIYQSVLESQLHHKIVNLLYTIAD